MTASLPNAAERPEGEREALEAAWRPPQGIAALTRTNNTYVGIWYIGTALLFFVLAGTLALLMRLQLAAPLNTIVGQDLYNQLFTMHGTMMMFLFAVPAVEAVGILLLPNMLGARDLPFPRLGAYAFWAYFIGGLAFFSSLFFGLAPDGGWFMYPPLTSKEYSPGLNADFYLLGIGFIEISAIAGAIEIIVGIMKTRAPGMTLDRLPLFAWAMLAFAIMVIFAFPAVILATLLLEIERALNWPFFIAARGGDPLLWQHLFWFFGHPEVYIIFIPAAGMVAMILPTMCRTEIAGYALIVVAFVATAFISFGVWAHHMFTTGMPAISVGYFSAASMAVAVPAGIQIFAFIATIAAGTFRFAVPGLFMLGFVVIFVMGGLTGVMVAMVPFDWQAHDTYFIVAHLHYVLIGGMVFPLFGAIYYWAPLLSRTVLSERIGRWVFGLMFAGTHVTFFPMHFAGLMGMPRRVWTYPAGLGWEVWMGIATAGAAMIALGVLLFVIDAARHFRFAQDSPAGNVWNGGTLEWLPNGNYGVRSIPRVDSRYPLWSRPGISDEVRQGRWYLPGIGSDGRETIVTDAFTAEPQYVMRVSGPGWSFILAAVFTAAFFLLLTVKQTVLALVSGAFAVAAILVWTWQLDRPRARRVIDLGGGLNVPAITAGHGTHVSWAMGLLITVAATLFAMLLFSTGFLWSVNPGAWPPEGQTLPPVWLYAIGIVLWAGAGGIAVTLIRKRARRPPMVTVLVVAGALLMLAALGVDGAAHHAAAIDPEAHAHGAIVWVFFGIQAFFTTVSLVIGAFVIARAWAGLLTETEFAPRIVLTQFWTYTAIQGAIGLVARALPHAA